MVYSGKLKVGWGGQEWNSETELFKGERNRDRDMACRNPKFCMWHSKTIQYLEQPILKVRTEKINLKL